MEKEIRVSSRSAEFNSAEGFYTALYYRGWTKVVVVATVAPPRRWGWRTAKRGKEPWTVRQGFPCSWKRNGETHLLLLETNRIQRQGDWGRNQPRPSSRRKSCCHRCWRDNRLQSVHRHRIWFITNLKHKQTSHCVGGPCTNLCRAKATEV